MVEPLISNQEGLKEQFVDADGIMLHCLEWDPDLLEIQSPSTQKHNNSGGYGLSLIHI